MRSLPASRYLVQYLGYYTRMGRGYIVMEWVKGRTLRSVARRSGPFDREKAIDLAIEVLEGIEVVHRSGFVHGDFHPKNVMVTDLDQNRIKIIDFQHTVRKNHCGRARALRKLPKPPLELAPETRRRYIGDSYDIYGVGYMIAFMLLGRTPTRSRLKAVKAKKDRDPLWDVVFKAMHRRPGERFAAAREMIQALHDLRGFSSEVDEKRRPGQGDGYPCRSS